MLRKHEHPFFLNHEYNHGRTKMIISSSKKEEEEDPQCSSASTKALGPCYKPSTSACLCPNVAVKVLKQMLLSKSQKTLRSFVLE